MKRRGFLLGGAGATLGLAVWSLWPDEGLWNPCRPLPIPEHLLQRDWVREAWTGLDPTQVWDMHVHLFGASAGDEGEGAWVNPAMRSFARPFEFIHYELYANAACANASAGPLASRYVERLLALHQAYPPGARLVLLAMDFFHDEAGERLPARTMFRISDDYAQRIAAQHPEHFEWIASIHPYRPDCVEALQKASVRSARGVKWIPSMMGIDPASPLCDRFYAALARLNLPLLTHGGEEHPLRGSSSPELNNPLALRRALEHGVRVVVAHCASAGTGIDTDRGRNAPMVENFTLFSRLMDDPRFEGRLFGDLAAVTESSRVDSALSRIVGTTAWHGRLLNGSDYPLPGFMPSVSLPRLVEAGHLMPERAQVLREIRQYNPLLFDFLLKRQLAVDAVRLPAAAFETARFFAPAA